LFFIIIFLTFLKFQFMVNKKSDYLNIRFFYNKKSFTVAILAQARTKLDK